MDFVKTQGDEGEGGPLKVLSDDGGWGPRANKYSKFVANFVIFNLEIFEICEGALADLEMDE